MDNALMLEVFKLGRGFLNKIGPVTLTFLPCYIRTNDGFRNQNLEEACKTIIECFNRNFTADTIVTPEVILSHIIGNNGLVQDIKNAIFHTMIRRSTFEAIDADFQDGWKSEEDVINLLLDQMKIEVEVSGKRTQLLGTNTNLYDILFKPIYYGSGTNHSVKFLLSFDEEKPIFAIDPTKFGCETAPNLNRLVMSKANVDYHIRPYLEKGKSDTPYTPGDVCAGEKEDEDDDDYNSEDDEDYNPDDDENSDDEHKEPDASTKNEMNDIPRSYVTRTPENERITYKEERLWKRRQK